ncbi:fatty acid synthase-like [Toxorhynchites rutilus septentrionalis]|uniref:fatty acid synthase-like n=1 Tax=Toxorhynchites rutilus septentrionalis TaxID=329112 RepID=UPI002478B9D1|nr:fatty acid synthase-like [Toxorhynchites rutilus septentrionalis]
MSTSTFLGSVRLNDCVVISGISGRFPQSDNMHEFAANLYSGRDLMDDWETRWPQTMSDVPRRSGKINNLDKFDREFFGFNRNQCNTMDAQQRLLLEHVYEAILDAGVNPETLRGSKTGVFTAVCYSESEARVLYQLCPPKGRGILGCAKSQLANRISYTFDFRGPSMVVDTACSSSMYALDIARRSILSGQCDAAVVTGTNLCLHPYISYQFSLLGVLAKNGIPGPFDQSACGYTRAEVICAILLQKTNDANRIYAYVLHSKTNCDGFKSEGITYPSGVMQKQLLTEFYNELAIDPATIAFIEAHSTGTVVGDPEECDAIDRVFCANRSDPLPIGSVKSNIGHSEASAGLASIAKCIIAMERGIIPPNIHYLVARSDVPALIEGRLKVVDCARSLDGPLIAINSFGFGGANGHTLIHRNTKQKIKCLRDDNLPRLVIWSGRTQEAIDVLIGNDASRFGDAEYVSLLYNIQRKKIPGHRYRGFGVYSKSGHDQANLEIRRNTRISLESLPLVVVFPGVDLQWREHLESFGRFPVVQSTVTRCCSVLESFGCNLFGNTIGKPDLLQMIVGSTVLQIAYVDLLVAVGVNISAFGGHSVGQLTCAYLDQCLNLDEVLKLAHSHGVVLSKYQSDIQYGAFLELDIPSPAPLLSFDRFIQDSILSRYGVVGGPLNPIRALVDQLKFRGKTAEYLPFTSIVSKPETTNDISKNLFNSACSIIPTGKHPSRRWFSARSLSQLAVPAVHSPTSTVSLIGLIPTDCQLLVPLIRQSMNPIFKSLKRKCNCVPIERQSSDLVMSFLCNLGHLYLSQQDINLLKLYPPVQFPVSRGTPMISPLVRWDHRDSWSVVRYEWSALRVPNSLQFKISLSDQNYQFAAGHCIDGKVLLPAMGYLSLVWELVAFLSQREVLDCAMQFDDVQFLQATPLVPNQTVILNVMIQRATGRFEILKGATAVVIGYARQLNTSPEQFPVGSATTSSVKMASRDFYKELRLRGYHYGGLFKSVLEAQSDGSAARIEWKGNWIAFLDCMLQLSIIAVDTRTLMVPTAIESLTIYPKYHLSLMSQDRDGRDYFTVTNCANTKVSICGSIRISGVRVNVVGRRNPPGIPVIETYRFLPYHLTDQLDSLEAVRACVQIALENAPSLAINVVEMFNNSVPVLLPHFVRAIGDLPLIKPTLTLLSADYIPPIDMPNITVKNKKLHNLSGLHILISLNNLSDASFLRDAMASLTPTGFLVIRDSHNLPVNTCPQLQLIAKFTTERSETLTLFQKKLFDVKEPPAVIRTDSNDATYEWLQKLKHFIKLKSVVLFAQDDPTSGIIGLVNCISKETKAYGVQCVFVDDPSAPPFALNHPFYKQQLDLDLVMNIYRNGSWGSYRHLLLPNKPSTEPVHRHCYANCSTKGDLSSMTWFNGPLDVAPPKGELVRVVCSALNFRDVMIATGRLSSDVLHVDRLEQECLLGNEFSGVSAKGRRVMGVLASGAMATLVDSDPQLTWTVPDGWGLEEAATVPVVYGTVYTALFICSRIEKGRSILIHAGSGGVGLAAIQVCLAYGLEVFTTVGTMEKRVFIQTRYPQLKPENIGNSRDTSFEKMVLLGTGGRGVDYVLNSLAEEKLQASVRCLARNGHFLEIGKYDMAKNSRIAMRLFQKGLTFTAVMLDAMFKGSLEEKQRLHALLTADINKGVIKPLPSTVYPAVEIEKAFRYLASGKHIGKILLRVRESEVDSQTIPISYHPRIHCNATLSYIIIGGLGGFGLELADWLVLRGCRKLVLSSSRGITKPYQDYRIRLWKSYGVETVVSTADITSPRGCQQLFQEASELGPVVALFNLAVQLRDCILENQTVQTFIECLAPKALATKHLDEASRQLCPDLEHFVVFSSVSCGRGNSGQSNYGMANSVMERIVERRVVDGLPGIAIQWGAVGEVGVVADMAEDRLDMEIRGTLQQRILSCLQELDRLLTSVEPIVASMVVAEKRLDCSFHNIIEAVMNIISIREFKSISMDSSLADVGMDSLMAVEIKQVLERDFDLTLSPQELRTLTFLKLQKMVDERKINDESTNKAEKRMVGGIDLLLRSLGDEEFSGETLLRLSSRANEGRPILIIPGIEGVAGKIWRTFASDLNAPIYILQTLHTVDIHTIPAIVDHLMEGLDEHILSRFASHTIVAYSFGTLLALEIAKRLQGTQQTGKLILLDGAPNFLRKLSAAHIGENPSDEIIQKVLLAAIVAIVFPDHIHETICTLMEVTTFRDRIEKLIELAGSKAIYSPEYVRKITRAMFNRMKMVFHTSFKKCELSNVPVVLVRASEASVIDIEEDYGLASLVSGSVTLKIVSGTHLTMLENRTLVDIINSENV